jgi:hypothetical protein
MPVIRCVLAETFESSGERAEGDKHGNVRSDVLVFWYSSVLPANWVIRRSFLPYRRRSSAAILLRCTSRITILPDIQKSLGHSCNGSWAYLSHLEFARTAGVDCSRCPTTLRAFCVVSQPLRGAQCIHAHTARGLFASKATTRWERKRHSTRMAARTSLAMKGNWCQQLRLRTLPRAPVNR